MSKRQLSRLDRLLIQADHAFRTVFNPAPAPVRPSPAAEILEPGNNEHLSAAEQRHAAGLMRVNHSGEICAQALYQRSEEHTSELQSRGHLVCGRLLENTQL